MPNIQEILKKAWASQRFRTAIPIGLCLLIAWFMGGAVLFILVALVALAGQWECMGLFAKDALWDKVLALIAGLLYLTAYALSPAVALPFLALIMLAIALKYLALWKQGDAMARCNASAAVLFSFMYVPFLLAPVLHFSPLEQLFVVAVPAFSDIAAYAIGMRFGKTKIWPAVSPAKSVQGAAAGLVASFVVGFCFLFLVALFPSLSGRPDAGAGWSIGLLSSGFIGGLIGIFLGIMAQLGDFFESALKRSAGVKDSGTLLPGHGGILDRIDSALFSVAAYTVLLALFPAIF